MDRLSSIEYIRASYTETGSLYYLIPRYSVAIPKHANTLEAICYFLVSRGDYSLPDKLDDYPLVTESQLFSHFADWFIIPVLVSITIRKPLEVARIRERRVVEARRDKILLERHFRSLQQAKEKRESMREANTIEIDF